MHVRDKVDVWFDSYLVNHRGKMTWQRFCTEVCRRFGNIKPQDIMDGVQQNYADRECGPISGKV